MSGQVIRLDHGDKSYSTVLLAEDDELGISVHRGSAAKASAYDRQTVVCVKVDQWLAIMVDEDVVTGALGKSVFAEIDRLNSVWRSLRASSEDKIEAQTALRKLLIAFRDVVLDAFVQHAHARANVIALIDGVRELTADYKRSGYRQAQRDLQSWLNGHLAFKGEA